MWMIDGDDRGSLFSPLGARRVTTFVDGGDETFFDESHTLRTVNGEDNLVAQLRAGDDVAFTTLVDTYHARLVRLAQSIVVSRALAEEVAQDTWLAVLRGIDRFEGRSSLRTWLFHICLNRARSTAGKEGRTSPVDPRGPAADAGWFNTDGSWTSTVVPWPDVVEDRLMAASLADHAKQVIEQLPGPQQQVVILRDVEGLSSSEVCNLLSITEANQRVLLHRGRTRVRSALNCRLGGE